MASLVFKPDTNPSSPPPLLASEDGSLLLAKNVTGAGVAPSEYVGYAVWDNNRLEHRIDNDTDYRANINEVFASCEACGGASFEFDSLEPCFTSRDANELAGLFPMKALVSSGNSVRVTGVGSGRPDSEYATYPIKWSNDVLDGDELTGYGKSVKELYDKAIGDIAAVIPNEGALTPPKKFCLVARDDMDGEAIWFTTDGWGRDNSDQIGLSPSSSNALIAGAFVGIGAEVWKCNYERMLEDLAKTDYEYGCIFYGYTVFGGNGDDWWNDERDAAYNQTRWQLLSFPTVRAGAKISFCVSTRLEAAEQSNTRTVETSQVEETTTVSTDSLGKVTTCEIAENTVTVQPLGTLEGVPLMVYNLKEFKNEVEPDKETVWEFESCGTPVGGYVVPKKEWCCSTNTWEYTQGGGESKITITVPESRTVMLGLESGGLWAQATDFVRGAQASIYAEKFWVCYKDSSYDDGEKVKEEHISGSAVIYQRVCIVGDAEISFT